MGTGPLPSDGSISRLLALPILGVKSVSTCCAAAASCCGCRNGESLLFGGVSSCCIVATGGTGRDAAGGTGRDAAAASAASGAVISDVVLDVCTMLPGGATIRGTVLLLSLTGSGEVPFKLDVSL